MEWKEKKRQRRRKKEKKEPDDPGITLLSYQFPQHIGIKCKKIKIKTKKTNERRGFDAEESDQKRRYHVFRFFFLNFFL